ncbi:Glutathione S-transferase, C-terminal domain [Chromobacterium violaceum]|uniref:Glutathione S-transferase, C-terminal domain n=1 Tax=Chromobacterium violaceum TaxID=536 RepID=A0A3S4IZL8_CHRVL|nr:Glutathione S-transferase, C-terminal domain [Chromobacterium violaceum]
MDEELAERPFLAGDAATIADVALYTYTAHAPEGDIPLAPYPHVRAWLAASRRCPASWRCRPPTLKRQEPRMSDSPPIPWHPGEREMQRRAGSLERMAATGPRVVRDTCRNSIATSSANCPSW